MSDSPFKGLRGLARIRQAFSNSLSGLGLALKHEAAFRQELLLSVLLIPVALVLPAPPLGRALMVGSVLLVLIVEMLNSAIEATVDRVSLERHELARRAKDMGSAAVLLSLLNVIAVWALVLTA